MKIAMMVRGFLPVPRPADMVYAPIDLAAAVAESLSRRGHKVDFYAPIGSHIKRVNVVDCNLRPLATNLQEFRELQHDPWRTPHYVPSIWDSYMVNCMFQKAVVGEYDVLHFHHVETGLRQAAAHQNVPVVYTLNDPVYPFYREIFDLYKSPNQHFISISDNQRREGPDLPFLATVHNGVDVKQFKFSNRAADYLLFAGRIVPEKGVKEAIDVAKQTRNRLLIIGPTYPESQGYFEQYVKPHLNEQILYLGYVEREKLGEYYSKAKAVLTPIQWEEPFGMTTIEAMASGAPVISFRRGAAPEIIKHGKTGFIVDTTAEMVEAVNKVKYISRIACRRHVERNFSNKKMANGYEAAFLEAIDQNAMRLKHPVSRKIREVPKAIRTISDKRRLKQLTKKITLP